MSDLTFSTILTIVQDLAAAIVFLLCAGAVFLALKRPKVRQWLQGAGPIVDIVLFLAFSALVYQSLSPILYDLLAFPRGLISHDSTAGFTSSARCLGGLLVLVGLALGAWQINKKS